MNTMNKIAAALLLAGATGLASAATVYADDFNADTLALNAAVSGWTLTDGTVDVIGPGFYDLLPGQGLGNYIDLDGSTNDAGLMTHTLNLTAGVTYTLSFGLAGNQRGAGLDTVAVTFGGTTGTFTRNASDALSTETLTFTALSTGSYTLSFADLGGDNQGAILDNVTVTSAVPEPASGALMIAALGLMGLKLRRRR